MGNDCRKKVSLRCFEGFTKGSYRKVYGLAVPDLIFEPESAKDRDLRYNFNVRISFDH